MPRKEKPIQEVKRFVPEVGLCARCGQMGEIWRVSGPALQEREELWCDSCLRAAIPFHEYRGGRALEASARRRPAAILLRHPDEPETPPSERFWLSPLGVKLQKLSPMVLDVTCIFHVPEEEREASE